MLGMLDRRQGGKVGHKTSECRWESPTSTKKTQTAEKAENLNQKKIEKSEECGSSGMWRRSRKKRRPLSITRTHTVRWKKAPTASGSDPSPGHMWSVTKKKKAPAFQGADPSARQVNIDLMNSM